MPGEPGLNYSLNHDEGSLRITQTGPAGDEVIAAAIFAFSTSRQE